MPGTEEIHTNASGEGGVSEMIMHHITDSSSLKVPFLGEVELPHIEIFGIDISITKYTVMMWIAMLVVGALFIACFRKPREKPRGLAALLELLAVFVRDEIAIKNIGPEGARYTPYLMTVFFFILVCNSLGLIPYLSTPTGNVNVTGGLALISFFMIHLGGVRKHGFFNHWKNILPSHIPLWLIPILLPVEIMTMFAKPFALCIRLFANMTAGHVIILALIGLIFMIRTLVVISVPFSLFISLLEILIILIQAYIFTMLTALFIGLTVHPAH